MCCLKALNVENVLSGKRITIPGNYSRKLEDIINEIIYASKEGNKTPTAADILKMLNEGKQNRKTMEEYK